MNNNETIHNTNKRRTDEEGNKWYNICWYWTYLLHPMRRCRRKRLFMWLSTHAEYYELRRKADAWKDALDPSGTTDVNNCYNCCVDSFLTLLTISPSSRLIRKAEQIVWLASIGSKNYNGSITRQLELGPARKFLTVIVPREEWGRARLTFLSTTPCRSYKYAVDTAVRGASSISLFQKFRTKYLLVLVAVMLADGLQGELYIGSDAYYCSIQKKYMSSHVFT